MTAGAASRGSRRRRRGEVTDPIDLARLPRTRRLRVVRATVPRSSRGRRGDRATPPTRLPSSDRSTTRGRLPGAGASAVGALPFDGAGDGWSCPRGRRRRDESGKRGRRPITPATRNAAGCSAVARSHRPRASRSGPRQGRRRMGRDGHGGAGARRDGTSWRRSCSHARCSSRPTLPFEPATIIVRLRASQPGLHSSTRAERLRRRHTRAARAPRRARRRVAADGRHRPCAGVARGGSPLDRAPRSRR